MTISKELREAFEKKYVNKKDVLTRWGQQIKNRSLRKGLKEKELLSFIQEREEKARLEERERVKKVIKGSRTVDERMGVGQKEHTARLQVITDISALLPQTLVEKKL